MAILFSGCTDSPVVPGWQSGPRQTHPPKSDKTVIRRATDVHAKLGEQYSADGNGDGLHFAPDPVKIKRHRCHPIQPQVIVVVSPRPTIITFAPLASDSCVLLIRTARHGVDAIGGYDEVARSSALNCWANTHAKRPISTQC